VLAVVFTRFLGVSILIPGVLVPGVWVLGVASQGVPSQGVASSGPGGFRLTRLLRVVAGELWLASCGWRVTAGELGLGILKGILWEGLCR
jgi:hypothetical protein